jgi:GTP pyrophosphokinase
MSEEKQMLSVSEQPSTTLTIDDVIAAVEQYHPKADLDLIRRAYTFGAEAHKEQKRLSGIPYISHPLAVAHILTQLKMDAMTIASALLHDTIEDTGVTAQQVAERFGNDVAVLVEGVTKLSKLEFASREERQAESFRKMVVAMAKDIRVILVKLADRLHNVRTLEHMPESKQRATAQETLDIYAPLAHRLGIAWIQSGSRTSPFAMSIPGRMTRSDKACEYTGGAGTLSGTYARNHCPRAGANPYPVHHCRPAQAPVQHLSEDATAATRL